ncbi:hypothetical protein PROFUN_13862 [Planoprotostelium fungivorum]|uniref:Uncharacterized protein n=1 Tax=Planoprotostelium fungivorum TaxID=1890364 RepID=A0A2P6N2U2_9EUKA|nr:hypothetical protein PROFUN_13862 [Planoprotostelium fungivorum]
MSNTAQAPISLRTPSLSRIKTAKTEAERTDIVKEVLPQATALELRLILSQWESITPLSAHITPAVNFQRHSFSSWLDPVILVLAIFTGLFTYESSEKAAALLAATNNTASNYVTAQEAATWAGYAKPQFILSLCQAGPAGVRRAELLFNQVCHSCIVENNGVFSECPECKKDCIWDC